MERRVIIIAGPTCSGKTALALNLALKLKTEIISADSRQIYKYMDIGTAKPDRKTLDSVPHHLIDALELDEIYNASAFELDSRRIIAGLHAAGKIPVIAGGTGLYISALINGIVDIPPNDKLRKELISRKEQYGNEYIYAELEKTDPKAAATMLPVNWKRVIRALEVKTLTGISILEHHTNMKKNDDIKFFYFGLRRDRDILYDNIDRRVDKMIEAGLIDEVTGFKKNGYTPAVNALNTVGYKEIFNYLDGVISLDESVRLIKRNTRHYAKRQMTWFRAQKDLVWLDVETVDDMAMLADNVIMHIKQ